MTAFDTWRRVRMFGGTLRAEGGRLRCRLPRQAVTPELERALRRHKPAILGVLEIWGPGVGYLVLWFLESAPLAREPFQLHRTRRVTDPSRYFYQLYVDIQAGPAGPRARTGALQKELRLLHTLFEGEEILEGEMSGAEDRSPSETRQRYERAKRA